MSNIRSTSNTAKDLQYVSRSRFNKSKGLVLLAEIEQLKAENGEKWRKANCSLKLLCRENKFGNRETQKPFRIIKKSVKNSKTNVKKSSIDKHLFSRTNTLAPTH